MTSTTRTGPMTFSIGELAERAGTTTSAIRYYEERGLVAPVGRESGRQVCVEPVLRIDA